MDITSPLVELLLQFHRLHGLKLLERNLGRHDVSVDVSHVLNHLVKFFRLCNNSSTNGDVMSIIEFGGRLHGKICSKIQRPAYQRGGKCCITNMNTVEFFCDFAHG